MQQVRQIGLPSKILILSSALDDERVLAAVRAGADGYILKASRVGRESDTRYHTRRHCSEQPASRGAYDRVCHHDASCSLKRIDPSASHQGQNTWPAIPE